MFSTLFCFLVSLASVSFTDESIEKEPTGDSWLGGLDVLRTFVGGDEDEGVSSPSAIDDFAGAEFGLPGAKEMAPQSIASDAIPRMEALYSSGSSSASLEQEATTNGGSRDLERTSSSDGPEDVEESPRPEKEHAKESSAMNGQEHEDLGGAGDAEIRNANKGQESPPIQAEEIPALNQAHEMLQSNRNVEEDSRNEGVVSAEERDALFPHQPNEDVPNRDASPPVKDDALEDFPATTDYTQFEETNSENEVERADDAAKDQDMEPVERESDPQVDTASATHDTISKAPELTTRDQMVRDNKVDDENVSHDGMVQQLQSKVNSLQEILRMRESQLERLQGSAVVQDTDSAARQLELQDRLEATEKKLHALAKAREILKRQLSKAQEEAKTKTEEVEAVMEEGERLSKKQLVLETTIKKLRSEVKQLKENEEQLKSFLSNAESRAQASEREIQEARASAEALEVRFNEALASERLHFENTLAEARKAAAEADTRAMESVKAGSARKLKDAEARIEALQGSIDDLRSELERQRNAADEREDTLHAEIAQLQQRCSEYEARLQQTQEKIPEATAPLLRQLEAMQAASEAQQIAAIESERQFAKRVEDANEQLGALKSQLEDAIASREDAQHRCQTLEKALFEARAALREAEAVAKAAGEARSTAMRSAADARAELAAAQEARITMERVYAEQLEALEAKEEAAREAAMNAKKALESFKSHSGGGNGSGGVEDSTQSMQGNQDGIPTFAAPPGFEWQLVRKGVRPMHGASGGTTRPPRAVGDRGGDGAATEEDRSSSEAQMLPPHTMSAETVDGNENAAVDQLKELVQAGDSRSRPAPQPAGGMRSVVKETRVEHLQHMVFELQVTRDRLLEELVALEREVSVGKAAAAEVDTLKKELDALKLRYETAVELLGEREEKLEELQADLEDVKTSFRGQVAALADEVDKWRSRVGELEGRTVSLDDEIA